MSDGFVTGSEFSRYSNLDNIEWKIINYLINDQSKYAEYLWKILKYDTEDCLTKPNLTKSERMDLVYKNNGDATPFRVFMTPFVDDAWEVQSSHLHIYLDGVDPVNHLLGKANICFELIIHNKIANIYGDASIYNDKTNPVELDEHGNPVTPYKNRASEMLKDVVAALNGRMVNGVGTLQFNRQFHNSHEAKSTLWNNRKFFGYKLIMGTMISGMSQNDNCGF